MIADLSSVSRLSEPAALGVANAKPSKLHDAAQQFESLVISEMLRAERESSSDASGSGGFMGTGDDSGSESAMDLAEGQLSHALAAGGGLGLAKMIERTLGHADNASRSPASVSSR